MFLVYFFIIWKIVDICVSLAAPYFIPYLGFFSYGKDMLVYQMPQFLRALSNFDGIFYIRIALKGYSYTEQAYFPVYPLLIRALHMVISNPIIVGILISHVAFIIACVMLYRYLPFVLKEKYRPWALVFLLAYPTSYYFGVMYTESVFFMFLIGTLLFAKKKRPIDAAMFAYLAALTRFIGVFLIIPLGMSLLESYIASGRQNMQVWLKKSWKEILLICAPLLGIGTYCFYLLQTTGDPLFFFHVQEKFGANRSSHLISPPQVLYRYMKIFITADMNFQYAIAVLELCFYIFVISLLTYDLWNILKKKGLNFMDRLGLNIFSWVNILIPSLTGTLTAIPRYSLMSISIFFVLAEIENKLARNVLFGIFCVMHIVMFAFFIQGYYVT